MGKLIAKVDDAKQFFEKVIEVRPDFATGLFGELPQAVDLLAGLQSRGDEFESLQVAAASGKSANLSEHHRKHHLDGGEPAIEVADQQVDVIVIGGQPGGTHLLQPFIGVWWNGKG